MKAFPIKQYIACNIIMLKLKTLKIALAILSVTFLLAGCTSKYTLPSSTIPAETREINQHVRWIKADSQVIYHMITSPDGMRSLCPDGTIVSYLSPSPYSTGDIVETRIDHIFKLKWTSKVEQVQANRSIRLVFQNGFFSGGQEKWDFTPDKGGTRVSHTIIVPPMGILKQLVWVTKVRHKHDQMVELFLNNLKKYAETTHMQAGQDGSNRAGGE